MSNWFARYRVGTLLAMFASVFLAGFLGAQFTDSSLNSWYATIEKPSWNPPSWVFAPVWTTLYCMIAVSGWLLWHKQNSYARSARWLFVLQLVLNALWSALFFGLQSPSMAAVGIVLLWLSIGAYIAVARRVQGTAAWLFVPYMAWVSFAAVLNFTVWFLNV